MIENGQEARKKLLNGVNIMDKAVSTTLGPKGRNVAIQKPKGVHVTKDGVTVASAVHSSDAVEQMAINMVREAASNTVKGAGDGTTTATVIASELIRQGMKLVEAGHSPIEIIRSLNTLKDRVLFDLDQNATDIEDDQVKHIATISSNNDEEIGSLIAEAIEAVGKYGIITVEESDSIHTDINVTEGMQFDRGYLSSSFVTDPSTLMCELKNPLILIYNKKITQVKEITPALAIAAKNERPLLIICDGMEHNALSTVIVNSDRGVVQSCVVQAPAYGEIRKEHLTDIATLTGGKFINTDEAMNVANVDLQILGSCSAVKVGPNETLILEGDGDADAIAYRVASLRKLIELEQSPYEQKKLKERLGKLDGGAAVIRVGASSNVELKEKRDRIDDALGAAKAAISEGVIAGGGLEAWNLGESYSDPNDYGAILMEAALKRPFRLILENAGLDPYQVLSKRPKQTDVYNALRNVWVDPMKDGLLDPKKVLRLAIQNAVSVASMILTTECLIYSDERPELQQAREL